MYELLWCSAEWMLKARIYILYIRMVLLTHLLFATMGSGSLAAMAVFESKYREPLTVNVLCCIGLTVQQKFKSFELNEIVILQRDEGIKLVAESVCSGIFNDLGSGSNVDICVITKGKQENLRNYALPNPRTYFSENGYSFSKKSEVLLTKITPPREVVEVIEGGDVMEE